MYTTQIFAQVIPYSNNDQNSNYISMYRKLCWYRQRVSFPYLISIEGKVHIQHNKQKSNNYQTELTYGGGEIRRIK